MKVVMYNNRGGPRMARYVRNVNATLFVDFTPEETLQLIYRSSTRGRSRSIGYRSRGSAPTTSGARPPARWRAPLRA